MAGESNAMHSYGSGLYVGGFAVGGQLNNLTLIAEVTEISGPKSMHGSTKVTHLRSPGKFHEYVPAIGDGDTLTFTLNYTRAGAALLYANRPTPNDAPPSNGRRQWAAVAPNGDAFYFLGHIQEIGPEFPDDDRVTIAVTVKVSGPVTFTPAA